jgi:hypothetical protein
VQAWPLHRFNFPFTTDAYRAISLNQTIDFMTKELLGSFARPSADRVRPTEALLCAAHGGPISMPVLIGQNIFLRRKAIVC